MVPGALLGGDHAVGDGSSAGVYNGGGGGGGEGRGASSHDRGASSRDRDASISGGEDVVARGTGGLEGNGRACFRGGDTKGGVYTGRSSHGCSRGEVRGGQERTERREPGCSGESRGGGRTGADEQKRQRRNNSGVQPDRGISSDYLVPTPSQRHPKFSTMPSTGNCEAKLTSTVEAKCSTSSTKRKFELMYDGDGDGDTSQGSTSGTYSELPYYQQFHDLFVCAHDMRIPLGTLAQYAANNRMVDFEVPAGDLCGQVFRSPTDDSRVLIARSAKILEQLHEYDRSIAGKYDFTNLTVYRKKKVKLSGIRPGSLQRLRKCHSDGDYSTFALQVHEHFFTRNVPSELKGWFCLLLEEPTSHEHLIGHSISLMEAGKAIFYFGQLYGELKALKSDGSTDYQEVVDYLDKRHCGWKKRAKMNMFTKEILEHPRQGKLLSMEMMLVNC